ncbi:TlpA family protein disulfide reductase [Algoriphagus boritolerans]|uniref:Peroxiredoxin n=1 Tax=Algoriphagus boritolerans DSM 17298 = JCM 18970 TaxID=1120964 RepID=A0A1H5W9S8_9BACT|nr:TlpA disulfide reductase family protein [Algoriphagus boritolerans]SEF96128.1 Peroxiredoxin [Algoriphagus boritolerans DSM 17298 = JCM 18970]
MRITLLFSIILLVLLLSGAWFGFSRYSANLEQRSLVVNLPSIEVSSMEGRSFYLREQIGTPLILIYFNSTCPICQSEAELIRKVFSEEQKVTFIWISSETVAEVKDFRDRYDFANLSNHTFLSDTLFRLAVEFKLTTVPATLVYDSKGALVEFFRGAVSMSDLKAAVKKTHDSSR